MIEVQPLHRTFGNLEIKDFELISKDEWKILTAIRNQFSQMSKTDFVEFQNAESCNRNNNSHMTN